MSNRPNLLKTDPDIYRILESEDKRQEDNLIMIASENYVSKAVLEASSSTLTNKYAEGYPGKRYYNGCINADGVESIAIERIKKLFGAKAANVQPHSGAQANMGVMMSQLDAGDTYIGMNLSHGGHLSHGSPVNFSGKYFNVVAYGVTEDTNLIDYDSLYKLAKEHKPKMIIAGASAYPRIIDFSKFKEIAHSVGAKLLTDIAHIAGLVATGEHPSPVGLADFVTFTTHKTLRGPRGGVVLCNEEYEALMNKFMFPGTQGGPIMHTIAAKAVALKEALEPEFAIYQKQIIKNAAALADELVSGGLKLVSGGTDNHLILIDLRNIGVTGKDGANRLEEAGITCNKNGVPFDDKSPFVTSGIRLGSPALTTRGLKEDDFRRIGKLIIRIVTNMEDDSILHKVKDEVKEICKTYPTDLFRV
ncbi:MAG: serine hydroxymethyltransferase [Leptospirales bacterium]|nr:serine hydroxymethyltransferase [Leptospirales bacterium]